MLLKGFSSQIKPHYKLKIANTRNEIVRLARFNATIHGDELFDYILAIFDNHPLSKESYWLYIENTTNNEIIASLTLLTNYWLIDKVSFPIAEMGFVGTSPAYRGQGWFGILNEYFEKLVWQHNYLFIALRGIPYFYSKFGYAFALPTDVGYLISANSVKSENLNISIRHANYDDINTISKLYDLTFQPMFITTAITSYNLLNNPTNYFYVIESKQTIIAYFLLEPPLDSSTITITQLSQVKHNILNFLLTFLKTQYPDVQQFIINRMPWLTYLDTETLQGWQWQIKILNLEYILQNMSSTLETRVAESEYIGLDNIITISDYRQIITLTFIHGKISSIKSRFCFPDHSVDLRIPPFLLPKLLLADKTIAELRAIHPDVLVKKSKYNLLNIVFPKLPSLPVGAY